MNKSGRFIFLVFVPVFFFFTVCLCSPFSLFMVEVMLFPGSDPAAQTFLFLASWWLHPLVDSIFFSSSLFLCLHEGLSGKFLMLV